MCDRSVTPKLECINGICAEPLTTTTGAPTTTTAAPECAGKGGLCYDSDTYNEYPCCNEVLTEFSFFVEWKEADF